MKKIPASVLVLLSAAALACARNDPASESPPLTPASTSPVEEHPMGQAAPAGHGGPGQHGDAAAASSGHHHGHHDMRFGDAERWAKVFDDPARDAWQRPDEVVRVLNLAPQAVVADIGAGTGYFLPHLSRAVGPQGKVLALDIEADMVRHMRERASSSGLGNVEARQVAPTDPGLADGSVDRVLLVNTWHHIPNRVEYGVKLRKALRKGGAVFVVDYTLDSPQGPPREHRLPPETVAQELRAAGMEAGLVDEQLPIQYVVAGRAPRQ